MKQQIRTRSPFRPTTRKKQMALLRRSRKRSFCWRALWHSVPDLLQRGAGMDGYACWWALLRPAGSVREAALARVGRGGAAAADPFGRGDSVAVSRGGVRFRLPHDLHALDRDDRTDYTPPGRGAGNPLLFACLTAALLGVLCAEAVRLSRTAAAIVLTAF